ncbi:ANTAR domain-containing protein [Streptomyces sp. 2231.1]|uniref:ANTAR domain-containing protein n=1 Tax=Streptomyces sp. 2231.1 TaxID=1855347 RepID=UPI00089A5035|nr:ANTAR domain-containing protein [Streptomyces sp. 2231.1]SEE39321.1 ANTAR domain-containing protein [Streptomyces sp. 2231.1]
MTSPPGTPPQPHNGSQHPATPDRDKYRARTAEEVAHLRQAAASHATIDQAIGVLICLHQISPDTGFTVLRTASHLAHTTLHTIADAVISQARNRRPLPAPIHEALDEALRSHTPPAPPHPQADHPDSSPPAADE